MMQMPIPDDWDLESFCEYSVCWPNSPQWKNILRGLVTNPIKGRFWDAATGQIINTQMAFEPALNHNLELPEVIMSCANTEIADALNRIALSLSAQATATATAACCGAGANGAGGSAPPLDPTEIPTDTEGPPPDGFESWEQYFTNRCSVATDIITKAKGSISNMSLLNLAGLTLIALIPILVPLMLDVVPGDELAVIGGVLLATLALGAGQLDAARDTVNDHFDELVCALFENGNADQAKEAVETAFNDAFSADNPSSPFYFGAVMLWKSLMNPAVINRLATLDANINLPEGDCSGCLDICADCLVRINGDGTQIAEISAPTDGFFTLQAEFSQNGWNVFIDVVSGSWQLEWDNLTGHTTFAGNPDFGVGQDDFYTVYGGEDFGAFQAASAGACIHTRPAPMGQFIIRSSTDFQVDLKITACEE